jgi:hypothetical protein
LPDNHKPELSSETALSGHEIKPTAHGDATQYDLSFSDGSGKYEYQGIRNSDDKQYGLVFDPVKKHFVLHQVDSTFDMNLKSTPWNQDPTSLREAYPQIQIQSSPKLRRKSSQIKSKTTQLNRTSADAKRRKAEKPKKAKTPPKEPTPDAEDEDSDDGLTIEYPGGAPLPRYQSHPSPLPFRREQEEASEESDADAEDEDHDDNERNMDVDILELPSPAANIETSVAGDDEEEEEEDDELEQALAAELEEALEKETGPKADESSESEEE